MDHREFIEKSKECVKRSRDPFIVHYKEKYHSDNPPPYWILVHVLGFGQIVTVYKGASPQVKRNIADELGVPSKTLCSWLKTLNVVRNITAHHGRLWNRVLGVKPRIPKNELWHDPVEINPDRIFAVLTILSYLLEIVAPNTHWRDRLFELLKQYENVDLQRMGFPDDWRDSPLWCKYFI